MRRAPGREDPFALPVGPDRGQRVEFASSFRREPGKQRLFGKLGRVMEIDRPAMAVHDLVSAHSIAVSSR